MKNKNIQMKKKKIKNKKKVKKKIFKKSVIQNGYKIFIY